MSTAYEALKEHLKNPSLPVIIEETNQVRGEIFAFLGMGIEGCGTSTTVLKLAERLSQAAVDKRVLLMDLNIVEPELEDIILDIRKRSNLNFDQVYNLANSGKISGRDVCQCSSIVKGRNNLFFIAGTRLTYLADHFDVEVIRAILQAARQEYEYIIVDVSAHFDNAATVAALIEADIITTVTDYSGASLRNFSLLKKAVLEMHPNTLAKVKVLGVENRKAQVSREVIEEVLGQKVIASILNEKDPSYFNSLDKYLGSLELEHPLEEKIDGGTWKEKLTRLNPKALRSLLKLD